MYNLSDLIKTDCCIDCGTNEELREVVEMLNVPKSFTQEMAGIMPSETQIDISCGKYTTCSDANPLRTIPLTSINIDL